MIDLKRLTLGFITILSLFTHPLLAQEEEETENMTKTEIDQVQLPPASHLQSAMLALLAHNRPFLKPDIRNGLVRVAFLGVETADPKIAKALTSQISHLLTLQPHLLVVNQTEVDHYTDPLHKDPLPFDLPRKISLSRLLAVRYAFTASLQKKSDAYELSLDLISLKQQNIISKASIKIENQWIKQVQNENVHVKTKFGTVWRSMLVPGLGQIYQSEYGRGIAYLGLTATTLGLAMYSQWQSNQAIDGYQSNQADSVDLRADAKMYQSQANLLWLTLGGIWLTNVLDAWITAENRMIIQPFSQGKGNFGLSLSTSF